MTSIADKFRGCLLGGMIGDVVGAVVEAESPGYILSRFRTVDDILATGFVEEFAGPPWQVGRFTDDTQMIICVAEWLLEGRPHSAERLLDRFAAAFEPWRRYGPGTERILRFFPQHRAAWRDLATVGFPEGSMGNGSAMRVAPVGLRYFNDPKALLETAIESSRPTHVHPIAFQGAVIQATAVSAAVGSDVLDPDAVLRACRQSLEHFAGLMQSVSAFSARLDEIERGLEAGVPCIDMADRLGTGVTAEESVPIAIYCALAHPRSFRDAVHDAIFIGGDTDTIAAMTGAIVGASLGETAIPPTWIAAVQEDEMTPDWLRAIADELSSIVKSD